MIQRIAQSLALTALLSSCTTYAPQPGESTARLRVVTYSGDNTNFSVDDMSACPSRKRLVFTQISGLTFGSSAKIGIRGMPEDGYKDATELLIPAKGRLPMVVGSGAAAVQYVPGYSCSVGLSFEPKPGAEYELQYRYDDRRCAARLYELAEVDSSTIFRRRVEGATPFRAEVGTNLCAFR